MIKILLSSVYLLFAGLAIIQGTWSNSQPWDKPAIYRNSEIIQAILNFGLLLYIGLTVILWILYSWQYALGIFVFSLFFGKLLFYKLAEMLIILPIYKLIIRNKDDVNFKI